MDNLPIKGISYKVSNKQWKLLGISKDETQVWNKCFIRLNTEIISAGLAIGLSRAANLYIVLPLTPGMKVLYFGSYSSQWVL